MNGNAHEHVKYANESEIWEYTYETVKEHTSKSNISNLTQISKLKIRVVASPGNRCSLNIALFKFS